MSQLIKSVVGVCGLLACNEAVLAQPLNVSFFHENWEIYCSNTGTCRAAGYNANDDGEELPASILLTRKAGAKQNVRAEVALSFFEEEVSPNKLKNIHFYLNNKDLGAVNFKNLTLPLMAQLTPNQTQQLLSYANKQAKIQFKNQNYIWTVSDAGMTAVLLKMDDVQKRIGTVGALIKKGSANENNVLVAQTKPMVRVVKTANQPYLELTLKDKNYQKIRSTLIQTLPRDSDCSGVYSADSNQDQPQPIEFYKLSNGKVFVQTLCWRAAYNEGYGTWLWNEQRTGQPIAISESATAYEAGQIYSIHKGRGIGDCISRARWVWNGQKFVQVEDRWTGMCRGLALGGVWSLDLIEMDIK